MKAASRVLLSLCLLATPARGEDNLWRIGPRSLPPPANASEALRKALGAMPTPDLSAMTKAPATTEEWKALIAARDAEGAQLSQDMARKTGVAVVEDTIAGVRVFRVTPAKTAPEHKKQLFLHIHGGAWAFNGGLAATGEAAEIAARLGIPVISIDYRRPPDFPAPAAMDDVVAVWKELTSTRRADRMAMGGTSAGGNLTLVATLKMKELGLPLPAALFVGAPVVDMNKTGDSRFLNDGVDPGLTWDGVIAGAARIYAGGMSYDDPHLSPIRADVSGFPPTYLVSGTRDLLLSDTVLIHAKLRKAGVDADLHVYEGVAHAEYLRLFDTPESVQHFAELKTFVLRHLAK